MFTKRLALQRGMSLVATACALAHVGAYAQQARVSEDHAAFEHRTVAHELQNKTTGTFTVTAVGDLLIQEPIGPMIDPKIRAVLKNADTTVGNMEATIIDRRNWPNAFRGNWSPKETAADLKDLGFDMLTGANNHVWDMGIEGMKSTAHWLDEQGIPLAGIGPSMEVARMPVFQYTPKGRIAMIGAYAVANPGTSSFLFGGRAWGATEFGRGGSWGFNALTLDTWNVVTPEQLTQLKGIRDTILARRDDPDVVRPIRIPRDKPDRVEIFGDKYIAGSKSGEYHYEPTPGLSDYVGNITAVRNAKEYSDFVIYTMHVHQNRYAFQAYSRDNYPTDFLKTYAREVIDNGADMYLGHGNHSIQGIEIYKGRPIFYNLGNFAIHEILLESPDAKPGVTAVEADEVSNDFFQKDENLVALVASTKYIDGKLAEVKLYPVDLGVGKSRPWSQMSIARTPSPELARKILLDVQRFSEPFGTKIAIEDGIGIIRVSPSATEPLKPSVASPAARP